MTIVEPRFDRDLAYGKQGELLVDTYLDWIARKNGRVETKTKRRIDRHFYVETSCDKGRTGYYQPAGMSVTESEAWAYVIAETGIAMIIPRRLLSATRRHARAYPAQETDGNCPTKGWLISFDAILETAARLLDEERECDT